MAFYINLIYSPCGDMSCMCARVKLTTSAMYTIMKLTNDSFHIKSHSGDGPVAR